MNEVEKQEVEVNGIEDESSTKKSNKERIWKGGFYSSKAMSSAGLIEFARTPRLGLNLSSNVSYLAMTDNIITITSRRRSHEICGGNYYGALNKAYTLGIH